MDILEIIKNRRSVRQFQKKEIPEEIVEKLIEALIWAPSAGNLQSRKFYFIFDQKTKGDLVNTALRQSFIAEAPLVIVGCADERSASKYGERGRTLFSICDVSASIQNLMLQAASEGLGTCWVGAFEESKVAEFLNLPITLRPIVICPVGYPVERPEAPARVSKEKAVEIIK
jgi:nitroreductase